jgi:hypothetical protein
MESYTKARGTTEKQLPTKRYVLQTETEAGAIALGI